MEASGRLFLSRDEDLAQAIKQLKIVEERLERIRFLGVDQNPYGIRDILSSEIRTIERTLKSMGLI